MPTETLVPDNKTIIKQLKLTATLLKLHNKNPFKIRTYANAVFPLEKLEQPIGKFSAEEISAIDGIGKSLAASLQEIVATGSFAQLDQLLEQTPEGVLQILNIKGLGAKKVRQIWQELGIESVAELKAACEQGRLAKAKGFGAKTQEKILDELAFLEENAGKLHWAEAQPIAEEILSYFNRKFKNAELAGDYRRRTEIVENLILVIAEEDKSVVWNYLPSIKELEAAPGLVNPYKWQGQFRGLATEIVTCKPKSFGSTLLLYTGSPEHLSQSLPEKGSTLLAQLSKTAYATEEEAYKAFNLEYIEPELREGRNELNLAATGSLPKLIEYDDLTGSLHNHSTYSDGKNTLEEMATACQKLGYTYLGISDHSQSAFYAGGLTWESVQKQHKEIDALNTKLEGFKIFKGIESDILADGKLDYPNEQLKSFDFIVASIHGNLSMSQEKATERLLTAIANPYTTMLGHPTGRLLLRRPGYPIDHQAVIDACVQHNVIIEINANPWRLDLDWRWVQYAVAQGAWISINPDAHVTTGLEDMYYGTLIGRKGGLPVERCFNAQTVEFVAEHFAQKKAAAVK
jgi:DNA polymerase (family 10)